MLATLRQRIDKAKLWAEAAQQERARLAKAAKGGKKDATPIEKDIRNRSALQGVASGSYKR
ncbi:hypothetical protein [Sporisorium scitamineum]|uniref:Uncharacterized protein n=1 Tax=Sporisorium scitamineum TaxID=49012 RepID=A0A0F7RYA7_9BASI|nr:hypothetical protein [Sporisorium scitamineum]